MATIKNPSKKVATPDVSTRTTFLFDKMNYYIMGAGVLMLIIGYLLMAGGAQPPHQFNEDEIYSFRRITLAPIIVIAGYIVIAVGILKKPEDSGSQ